MGTAVLAVAAAPGPAGRLPSVVSVVQNRPDLVSGPLERTTMQWVVWREALECRAGQSRQGGAPPRQEVQAMNGWRCCERGKCGAERYMQLASSPQKAGYC